MFNPEEFFLIEHQVSVDVMGTPYYAQLSGAFTSNPDLAFTHYTKSAALRIQADLYQGIPGMIVTITETTTK